MGGFTQRVLLLLSLISLVKALEVHQVCEDIPIGELAFQIKEITAGPTLTITLSGQHASFFRVQPETARVLVNSPLDRESIEMMNLEATISQGGTVTNRPILLIIKDANDNPPRFLEPSYDKNIPENTASGTSLFMVKAQDFDMSTAGAVRYHIDEVTPDHGMSLFTVVANTGEVRLNGKLNYTSLSTFYRMKINATDGGGRCYFPEKNYHSSTVFSFITVVDVADLDPRFMGIPYVGSVYEHSAPDVAVLTVIALDQDIGINDDILYSIESSTVDGLFAISESEGTITVLSDIDREVVGDIVTLTVKATESKLNIHGVHASTTTEVQINILDINDNKPEFYKCGETCVTATQFTGEVFENSLGSISFNMTVKDLDKISRTKLTLGGEHKDVFSVEPSFTTSDSIVQFLVRQLENLDYEKTQQMILQVIAVDEEKTTFSSTATVTIDIKDTNDNSPIFPKDTYELRVKEHSPAGTIVATITADDPDTMDKDNLTYRIIPESMLPYFDVEPRTGIVYVKNETLLDREARSLYSPTLQARDTDDKPGATVLEITLIDINDQPPVINRDSYLEFVKEGAQLEIKIEATDADEPGTINSQIMFRIDPSEHSGNFTIDRDTGMLGNIGELDREALDPDLNGRIQVNVTAVDKGEPPLSSTVPVFINVEDVNDNAPQFKDRSYSFSVKEGRGGFVGSIHAEDLDQTTEFNRISFGIVDGGFGNFIIRSFADVKGYRGNITVDPDVELDYEGIHKDFRLKVEAADLEQMKTTVMVVVKVLDVNDERPEFLPMLPVSVKENTTILVPIGKFSGHDKDSNHSLIYELESVTCRCKNVQKNCSWFILDPNGNVRVNPEHTVDYEECDQAVVVAQVVDEYTEKGENNSVTPGQMVINIEDINDNIPEFTLSDSVFVVVAEAASKGTSVAQVNATDRDSGIHGQIEFKVSEVRFEYTDNSNDPMPILFEPVKTQQGKNYIGIIQTTEPLDLSLRGKYLVTVTAIDTGGLSSDIVLDIFTVDKTYKVELLFVISREEVQGKLDEIVKALISATKASVQIIAVRAVNGEESRATEKTVLEAYFVYRNGTALSLSDVDLMLSLPEHFVVLKDLGLDVIGEVPEVETQTPIVTFVLYGMVAGLIITLAVLTTSLMCTRRNYKRKLKAAKAMNSASMVTSDNQKSGPVVPGTNKYTMEGANPVLNLHIDTALVLDLDEGSSDVDKVSLNSLDDDYDMIITNKETSSTMNIQEEDEEEEDDMTIVYSEPLGAALAQVGQKKKGDKDHGAFENPAFSTTDL
ncbi:cadherin-related family member 2 isoform X2 [Cololabis saira]|uniref:cadherin-related family member 2 isoform X2 n=1 Tax=Cololabis saira TaxID=129043 RepID=UPI002AD1F3FF|nr:cadherin-related family member 2 isoform X2 [Cololabis saira]